MTALVTANKADLGLAVLSPQSDGVETLPLAQLRVVAVMPTGHPLVARKVVRPKDLDGDGHYIGHVKRIDKIANSKPSPLDSHLKCNIHVFEESLGGRFKSEAFPGC